MTEIITAGQAASNAIGSCKLLFGTVRAVSADGQLRTLSLKSPVYLYDRIMTGSDGMVSILFNDAVNTRLDLGRRSDVFLDEDVFAPIEQGEVADTMVEVEQLQEALLAGGADPTIDLQPPAAGPAAAGIANDGGGINLARFELVTQEVFPWSGAETTGSSQVVFSEFDPTVLSADPVDTVIAPESTASYQEEGVSLVTRAIALTGDTGGETSPVPAVGPQDAILVDEGGNSLVADLRVSFDNDQLELVSLNPLNASGQFVEDGEQIFENGAPLLVGGNPVFWEMGENGAWNAMIRQPADDDNGSGDSGDHDDHDDHEKVTEMTLGEESSNPVWVKGYDEHDGDTVPGWLHANGQGMGVGNPFINMDANGSEVITFSFSETGADSQVHTIQLGIDHLSGEHGNKPAEGAEWRAITTSGEVVSGVFDGEGQGSGGEDQVLTIELYASDDTPLYIERLEMAYHDPTGEEGAEEVCGQGYRISSIKGFDSDQGELFSHMLKKSEGSSSDHDHDDGDDHDSHGSDTEVSQEPDQGAEQSYTYTLLFTVFPEMDPSKTMYTGNYVVEQNTAFHDNGFNFSLTGGEGGKLEEKVMSEGEMTLVVTGTDHDVKGASVVKGNGQGLGVGNPFVNMDSEGSEYLHFAFYDEDGDYCDMLEVTLGMDHLSGQTGGHLPEYAKWEAFVVDENGEKVLVGSDLFEGEGQGSGWKADQELTIKMLNDDGTPIYFNALDLSLAEESDLPADIELTHGHSATTGDTGTDTELAASHDHDDGTEHGDDGGTGGDEGHDDGDDGACGQGFRVSSIEGVFDPGDHTFEFAAVVEDGGVNSATVTFDVTFDGDGYVIGGNEDEVIAGSSGDDYLNGGGGDDIITGGNGDDILLGSAGSDELRGDGGEDVLDGGTGADLISGDDPGNPDNMGDIFNNGEMMGGEVVDYDLSEGDLAVEDPLDTIVPLLATV
ncbi:retention module-containing protein [Desulfopila sp. IMCC35008]|uniref:retention module-containing protein n=1 Tax=Desulfopila sp. IMCC35008 TaxID=2653858 RepID=UPI0013D0D9B3|nr:retention module-containing protein [Desulfopila sp. IMCC35008]